MKYGMVKIMIKAVPNKKISTKSLWFLVGCIIEEISLGVTHKLRLRNDGVREMSMLQNEFRKSYSYLSASGRGVKKAKNL